MSFQEVSQEKFESVFYGRTPYLKLFSTELAWFTFAQDNVTLLAVLLRCEIDKDFNAVILGRDLAKKFRAVDVVASLESHEAVLAAINDRIPELVSAHVDGLFPQGDEVGPFEIFGKKVPEEKRNYYLKLLLDDPTHYPARVMMEELAYWFKDPDGIFIRGLQGNEFNSRLFELYLHAAFYELGFELDRSYAQPDFMLAKAGNIVCVEAATVAELDVPGTPVVVNQEMFLDLEEYVRTEMPFKFYRTLLRKMRHKPQPANVNYWDLPHTQGHPFVLAIHDYSRRMSMSLSSTAMHEVLYGAKIVDGELVTFDEHVNGEQHIPSNFFGKDENRHLSAVILPTMATIPKFNRMGIVAGIEAPRTHMIIYGSRTDENGDRHPYAAKVNDPKYKESWHEGTFVFHNPNAIHPLDPELFPHVVHVFRTPDGFEEWVPANYLLGGTTQVIKVIDK